MRRRRSSVILILLALAPALTAALELTDDEARLLGPPAGSPLEGDRLEAETERIAGLMRCPVCQGLSVADSHTPVAMAMRGKVARLLAAGYSEEQVLRHFEASYGEFIRLAPKPVGFNLFVWIAPGLGLLAGVAVLAAHVRRGRRAPRGDGDLEAYRRRVREEVGT